MVCGAHRVAGRRSAAPLGPPRARKPACPLPLHGVLPYPLPLYGEGVGWGSAGSGVTDQGPGTRDQGSGALNLVERGDAITAKATGGALVPPLDGDLLIQLWALGTPWPERRIVSEFIDWMPPPGQLVRGDVEWAHRPRTSGSQP